MGENSKIEWTTHTFNGWRGCTKVAAGCANCYAERESKRNPKVLGIWGDEGTRVLASDAMWQEPIKWDKAAACYGTFDCNAGDHSDACPQKNRPRVFCASFADVFEEYDLPLLDHRGRQLFINKDGVMSSEPVGRQANMNDARRRLFRLIYATPNLDWLLLTKRPENIRRMWPNVPTELTVQNMPEKPDFADADRFLRNVWLGTSIATQEDVDRNIPLLLKCHDLSPVLFVSAEPLLGPIDLGFHLYYIHGVDCHDGRKPFDTPGIDWVICGGESGPKARPMNPDWARSLRDQCQAAVVPFFMKQMGGVRKPFQEIPSDLMIREFPRQ